MLKSPSFTIKTILILSLFMLISCRSERVHHEAPLEGSRVIIDAAALEEGIPRFYTYRTNDKIINFFVIKVDDEVLSYFDACAKCHPAKKGYTFSDGRFLCNHCGHGRSIHTLDKEIGGCYPLPLRGQLKGNSYEIQQAGIIQGGVFF